MIKAPIGDATSRAIGALGGPAGYGRPIDVSAPNIVSVLDDFTASCLSRNLNLFALGVGEQDVAYSEIKPIMFFSESAWNGNSGAWRHKITSSSGPRPEYINAVAAARRAGIPTVFWNKEDPPHFDEFIQAASLFDYVYTTEAALIPDYRSRLGHDRVALLRFAAAPHLHHPGSVPEYRSGEIAFAGQYFAHKFPERRQQMEVLFEPARQYKFEIYSRALGGDPNYQFPAPYNGYVVGSLPYHQMTVAYRQYKVFLNVNSVPQSQSMCARRVYELTSSKTAVVSVETPAIRSVFADDEVLLVRTPGEAAEAYNCLVSDGKYRRALVQRAWRRTAREHTYRDRIEQVLADTGATSDAVREVVTIFARAQSEAELDRVVSSVERQSALVDGCVDVEVVAIAPPLAMRGVARRSDDLRRVAVVNSTAEAVAISRGHYFGPWVRTIEYGRSYLEDMWLYLSKYATQQIVGKPGTFETLSFDEADNGIEETPGEEVLTGAWLARANVLSEELLEFGLAPDATLGRIPNHVAYRTDAFNVAVSSALPRHDWEV